MTHVLILNCYPYTRAPYNKWLEDLDGNIILLNSNTAKGFNGDDYAFYKTYPNFQENSEVISDAIKLYQQYLYDVVIAINEGDLFRAAVIREILGIPGQCIYSAAVFRNKLLMKTEVARHGIIKLPQFMLAKDAQNVRQFVNSYGLPVVIKPVSSSGSRNVSVINTCSQLDVYLKNKSLENMMIETYISNNLYHVDGLLIDNTLCFCSVSKYMGLGSYVMNDKSDISLSLASIAAELATVLPFPKHCTFHLEVFLTDKDEVVFCEIASRTGGSRINEMIRQSYDIDLTETWVRAQCHLVKVEDLRSFPLKDYIGFNVIPPRVGYISGVPSNLPFDFVTEYLVRCKEGQLIRETRGSGDFVISYMVKGDCELDVKRKLVKCQMYLDRDMKWSFPSIIEEGVR